MKKQSTFVLLTLALFAVFSLGSLIMAEQTSAVKDQSTVTQPNATKACPANCTKACANKGTCTKTCTGTCDKCTGQCTGKCTDACKATCTANCADKSACTKQQTCTKKQDCCKGKARSAKPAAPAPGK